jgi:hypothetical protein
MLIFLPICILSHIQCVEKYFDDELKIGFLRSKNLFIVKKKTKIKKKDLLGIGAQTLIFFLKFPLIHFSVLIILVFHIWISNFIYFFNISVFRS